jgi:hypothetical protein
MWINFTVFNKSGLEFSDLIFLAAISQTETDWLIENLTDAIYNRFDGLFLVKHIKPKNKKEHLYGSLRLSDKGKQFLNDLEEAEAEEQDTKVYDWLSKYYLNAGKEIGNRKRTLNHIKDFRIKSGIQKNNLIKLCTDFLTENEERSNKLEFVFYYPKTVFATRFQLEDSWLFTHYLKKENYFKSIFEEY